VINIKAQGNYMDNNFRKIYTFALFLVAIVLLGIGITFIVFDARYFRGVLTLFSSVIIGLEATAIKNAKTEKIVQSLMNNPLLHLGIIFQILGSAKDSMTFWLIGIALTFFALKNIKTNS
jgi:hypothetical protein